MLWILLLFVIFVVVAGLLTGLKGKAPGGNADDYPYTQIPTLFSAAERSFLGVLDQAVGEQYRIFGKVRVADVIQARRGLDNGKRQTAFNKIQSKHFDFLLCAKNDLSVLCAIELDDKSHQQSNRKERDRFLVNACRASGLPLLQVPAKRAYTVQELRARIYDSLESVTLKQPRSQPQKAARGATVVPFPADPEFGRTTGSSVSDPVLSEPQFSGIAGASAITSGTKPPHTDDRSKDPTFPPHPNARKTDEEPGQHKAPPVSAPACPKCGAAMVRRRVKSGGRAGLVFWGCSTYPKCRGALR